MRAIKITILFVVAMLWLGVQAAQTEPTGAAADETEMLVIDIVEAG